MQQNKTMEQSFAESGIKLYFVLEDDQGPEKSCHEFQKAFQMCLEKQLKPEWTSVKECKKFVLNRNIVLVLQRFEGKFFEKIRTEKCVILGPWCILHCLMEGEPTPDGPVPVYNMAMHNLMVCVSGFKLSQREDLKHKVEYMGGRFSRDLSEGVTHLVVSSKQGTKTGKYLVAAERKIPVMQESWIHECWNLSQSQTVHALQPNLRNLVCPPFAGMSICCSNLPRQKKENIKRLLEAKGGTYTPSLAEGETDVLVLGPGSSDKATFAKKWNVPCVSEEWVTKSVSAGYSLKFSDFEVKPETSAKTSTPEGSKSFLDPNFSMVSIAPDAVHDARHFINETLASEASFVEPASRASIVPPGRKGRGLSVSSRMVTVPEPAQHRPSLKPFAEQKTPEKTAPNMFKENVDDSNLAKQKADLEAIKTLEGLEMSEIKNAGSFLDGCKVYLSGFPRESVAALNKLLSRGGATRFDAISDVVSHVVVAGLGLSAEEQRAVKQSSAQVVRAQWLLDSLRAAHPLDPEPYLCFGEPKNLEPSPLSKKGIQMWQKSSENASAGSKPTAQDVDMVKQYMQFDQTTPQVTQMDTAESPTKLPPAVSGEEEEEELAEPLPSKDEDKEESKGGEDEGEQDEVTGEGETTLGATQIFEELLDMNFVSIGLKLYAVDLSKETVKEMKAMCVDYGGEWSTQMVDYLITRDQGTKQTRVFGKEVVTPRWVENCVENEQLLPVEYFHRPWQVKPNHGKPLANCTIAISLYGGKERQFLASLATELGAVFQEQFAKKSMPAKNVLGSTHLLCSHPESAKYNAAIKWKIPVVSKDWLLACAQDGVRYAEESYYLRPADHPTSMLQKTNTTASPAVFSEITMTPQVATKTPVSAVPARLLTTGKSASPSHPPSEKLDSDQKVQEEETSIGTCAKRLSLHSKSGTSTSRSSPPASSDAVDTEVTADKSRPSTASNHSVQFKSPEQRASAASEPFTPYTRAVRAQSPGQEEAPKQAVEFMTPKTLSNYVKELAPGYVKTPETPYGSILRKDPSPNTRKEWKKFTTSVPKAFQNAEDATLLGRKRNRDEDVDMGNNKVQKLNEAEQNAESQPGSTPKASPKTSPSKGNLSMEMFDPESQQTQKDDNILFEKKIYRFTFTGIAEEERAQLEDLIKELGGAVHSPTMIDTSVTHLIMATPARSEKLLSCIASGKWILHHRFLLESKKNGCFVPEEDHEWGNPMAVNLPAVSENSRSLANACFRWRSRLQCSPQLDGAYSGMRAIVHHGIPARKEAFERLIKTGGGVVLDIPPPFQDPQDATHCFVELKGKPVDLSYVTSKNIPCLNPVYLSDYLIQDPSPTPQQWLLQTKNKIK